MASNNSATTLHSPTYGSDPTTPNTTFVQADPSNFRAVVQKLTGASEDPSALETPPHSPLAPRSPSPSPTSHGDNGPKEAPTSSSTSVETRPSKKLELSIGGLERTMMNMAMSSPYRSSRGALLMEKEW
ncbi:hypothetical protein SESBI_08501 [Sesbania bispinosa]|nr:hypothetical protein SESBI_08501 [Sesbania bispinosa]